MKCLSPMFDESRSVASRFSRLSLFAVLCLFLAAFATQALAQEATIVGTVTDPTGAAVANASITITQNLTGVVRTFATNADGQYVSPGLKIGSYTLRAEAAGFKVVERKDIVLQVGDRQRIDLQLQVGAKAETITVEASSVAVQTDTGEVSNVINGNQLTKLTTNGRSLYTLFALAPGASSIQTDRAGFTPVSGDSNVSVNGQRQGHNLQLIDGGENLDRGGSSGSVMPSVDAIAEFRNITSNYSAEYGLSSGATISSVVKSGTRTFHASGWEYFRNDALNARNYFNARRNADGTLPPVTKLRYNVYGFNLGGQVPLAKEHPTFFFYNMEWRSQIVGGQLNNLFPLASSYPDAGGAGTGAVLPTTYNGKASIATVPNLGTSTYNMFANCPGGVAPAGITPGSAFPSNTIPDCMISNNARQLLTAGGTYGGIFPKPNNGPNFFGGNNSPTNVREEIARVDHEFSSKFSIFGHFIAEQISQNYGTSIWSGDNTPAVGNTFGNPSYSAVVHATHTISPTLLNEISWNYNGNRINIIPQGLVGAPSGFVFNRYFNVSPNESNRIPSIALGGITGSNYTVNWMPWVNKADDYQIRDDVSWTKGAHQLKFGFSWAIYKKVQNAFANTQGNFTFNGSITGYDYADYLLGLASGYNEDAVKINGHWNNNSFASYIQDNWRVTKKLTLNLGLRWDGIPHTYEANQLSSNFYPFGYNASNAATFETVAGVSNGNICGPTSSAALCPGGVSKGLNTSPFVPGVLFYTNGLGVGGRNLPGYVNAPNNLADSHWAEFGPRVGFAYDLTGEGKTVIRGGFGMMYERIQGNDMYNGATNPPGNLHPSVNLVTLDNPGTQFSTGNTITAATLPILPLDITGIDSKYPPPTTYQYSAGVQQAIGAKAVLQVGYVGTQLRNQNVYQAINIPALSALPAMVAAKNFDKSKVPYAGYGNIRLGYNVGTGHYNSLQTSLTGRVTRDLQVQAAYTFSKAIDTVGNLGSGGDLANVTNPYAGFAYDQGPSPFDRRNNFFINYVYDIPLLRNASGAAKAIAGGWSTSGIVTWNSAPPVNFGVSGNNAASILGNTGNRPDLSGPISYHLDKSQPNPGYFTGNFSAPVCSLTGNGSDCYGNVPSYAGRGFGRNNFDLALFKTFAFTERLHLDFRADAFNAFNHTQFKGDTNNGGLGLNVNGGNFGHVTSAFNGREWQLSLKASF